MDIHQRLEAFWAGERPDLIPYTIYQNEWRHTSDDPAWQPMYDMGLGVTFHLPSVRRDVAGVEVETEAYTQDGRTGRRRTIRTPVGEIFELYLEGWRQKHYLETADDYRVMTHVARHTAYAPAYAAYRAREAEIAPHGVALVALGRTPIQTILVDYVGLEHFAYHLFDLEAEVMALYEALLDNFRRRVELVAAGPGRFVSVLENFTAETMGPRRYEQLILPVYEELFPILHQADKIVGTHYDGQLGACRDLIARAPIDLIESLTPPPEGDMTLAECRAAWPDKLFWSNLNVACYDLPPQELKELVWARIEEGAPDGRRLAFEVSEQYPANWRTSIPVVLEALQEAGN